MVLHTAWLVHIFHRAPICNPKFCQTSEWTLINNSRSCWILRVISWFCLVFVSIYPSGLCLLVQYSHLINQFPSYISVIQSHFFLLNGTECNNSLIQLVAFIKCTIILLYSQSYEDERIYIWVCHSTFLAKHTMNFHLVF